MIGRQLGLLVGIWFFAAPFLWGYALSFNLWHSFAIGAVVLALCGLSLLRWSRTGAWLLVAVGAYAMVAPFLWGYIAEARAFWNDLVFGILLVLVGAAVGAAAVEYGGEEEAGRAAGRPGARRT